MLTDIGSPDLATREQEAAHRERLTTGARAIIRAARLLERASGDLSIPQYRVLTAILDGEHRASRIAGKLSLGKSAVSFTVDSLASRGLVVREWSEEDQRVATLQITKAGYTALRLAETAMIQRLQDLLDRAAEPEELLDSLTVLFDTIADRLESLHPSSE